MINRKRIMTTEQWGNIQLPGLTDEELHRKNWNFAKTKNDKLRRSQTVKKIAAERDEAYTQKLHQGIANRDKTYQAINNACLETRKKISASLKGKNKTQEHIDKVAAKTRERAKPVIVPWGVFRSGKLAGDAYNEIHNVKNGKNRVSANIKKGTEGYKFISIEEYARLTDKKI